MKLYKGQTLGIVGESGCGKSTLIRMLSQLENPTRGEILYLGKNIEHLKSREQRLLHQHMQMVFQDPLASLNPRMKIIDLLTKLQKEREISIIFICHDLALIQLFAHYVAVMYLGNIVETLPGGSVNGQAKHPYTKALLESVFSVSDDKSKNRRIIDGEIPSPLNIPAGCPFEPRCRECSRRCKEHRPTLIHAEEDHLVVCTKAVLSP